MIIFGADHAGFELKEYLKTYLYNKGFEIYDAGAFEYDSEDSFANIVPKAIKVLQESKDSKAIIICGSGVGVCIASNRFKGVYACNCHSVKEVVKAREHNNINVLNLGGRVISKGKAKKIVDAFIATECLGGKYLDRMLVTDGYDKK